ncbi:Protein CBG06409 [Caenorhabditis briggsae]|uniref:Glycosyltransferase family 92 protein n=1 Tax=Caenorhabditis briggsae TaxID=6238 RepID=A8X260_CAEBR|nr:Protein CBG06409 [Caenorhabditis briggsae]CAP26720.2 Protein CBG06409 [Caenorhabditis briggsae]
MMFISDVRDSKDGQSGLFHFVTMRCGTNTISLFRFVLLCCAGLLCWKCTYYFFGYSNDYEFQPSNQCHLPSWNQKHTNFVTRSVLNNFSRWLWMKLELSKENNQNYTSISILGAYVYPDQISISLTSQYTVQQNLFCRYYDCKQTEIPGSSYRSVVFPESVLHCPRRIGAEFVSVSRSLDEEEEISEPVRLTFRSFEKPPHDLTVCVGPMYGNESKWLQIVDFVEHMKLEGATFVYFYVGVISDYDRKILTDYVRTGDVEVIDLHDKYERPYYAWHLITIQDCHLRAKYHSKWVSFLDLDERISGTKNQSLIQLLNVQEPNVGEIQLPVLNIIKYGDVAKEFENVVKLKEEMIFRKWTDSIDPTWNASKAIVKPEKIGIMFIHNAIAKLPGVKTIQVNESQAVVRHLRSTKHRVDNNDWHLVPQVDGTLRKIMKRPLESEFAEKMTNAIVQRVLNVYDRVPVKCDRIARYLWESRRFLDPCESMSSVF